MSNAMNEPKSTRAEQELYFLIAKFLKNGPCRQAARALAEELASHKILEKRVHWTGREDDQSFDELAERFPHIGDNHLLQVLEHVGPLLDRHAPPSVSGIKTFLGSGRQSLLRKENDIVTKVVRTSLEFATSRNVNIRINSSLSRSTNIAHVVGGRSLCGFTNRRNMVHDAFYDKLKLHRRVLGHLAPVYCLLLDRTGSRIFTGADDNLVKIWSLTDGHLLMTLRGHQSEIADISLNCENTMLATGGLDKTIRVWDVKTGAPIAVLHGHSGGITSVEFSPSPFTESRCLISTGKDGSLCIWQWDSESNEFGSEPIKFNERQRVGDQLLCTAFSPGGSFLVTGGTDHTVRVYRVNPAPSQQIAELHGHTDQVLSIAFSQRGNRFLTGSDDGTARVWQYLTGQWRSNVLSMLCRKDHDYLLAARVGKLKVTMISWSCNDRFIITAANDTAVRIWDSNSLSLIHMLKDHQKDVYVLEPHSVDEWVLLTAGHDGRIILWNIETGVKLKEFENKYDSDVGVSGGAALLEGKSSADGLTYVLTDCQGSLSIYGFGSSQEYMKVPDHQFFHTDYRPLIRDANGYVLDEQTQLAPHLMPPPYVVNADGNPYPPEYQQIVCACKPRHRDEHSANDSRDTVSTREYEEGTSRLDAAIARLQRQKDITIASGMTDSSDSGVGSSQVEESESFPSHPSQTSDLSEIRQRLHQSSSVNFVHELPQMQLQMSSFVSPGCHVQRHPYVPQLFGDNVYPTAAVQYGSGGGLWPQYGNPSTSWPFVPESLQTLDHQGVAGNNNLLMGRSMISFSEAAGLHRQDIYHPESSYLASNTEGVLGQSSGTNVCGRLPQPLLCSPTLGGSQPPPSVSRLCPMSQWPEQAAGREAGVNHTTNSVVPDVGPSGLTTMPQQRQWNTCISSDGADVRHFDMTSQNEVVGEDAGISETPRENVDVGNSDDPVVIRANNEPISGSVASFLGLDYKEALMWWRSRVIVPDLPPAVAMLQEMRRKFLAEEELRQFAEESSKSPPLADGDGPSEPVAIPDSPRTQRRRKRNVLQQQLAEAAANARGSSTRRTRVVSMRSDEELAVVSSSSSAEEFEEEWHVSSDSSEYSDWMGDVGISIHARAHAPRTQRSSRRRRRVVHSVASDEDDPEGQNEPAESDQEEPPLDETGTSASAETSRQGNSSSRSRKKRSGVKESSDDSTWPPVGIDLSAYMPSQWLLQTEPTLNPLFPQLGDKVIYCWQGHEQYINAVILNDVYKIKTRHFPWQRLRLRPHEVCMVLSMHFVVGPPTLCSMKLGILSRSQIGTSVHHTFSLRYHDMADVPDFLIPYDHFKTAVLRRWTPGDRFRCKIDDAWWTGSLVSREPWQAIVPDSLWQCFLVQWDTGEEQEKLSPWDLDVVDSGVKSRPRSSLSEDLALALQFAIAPGVQTRSQAATANSSVFVEEQQQHADLLEILSIDSGSDDAWGEEGEAVARDRILRGLDVIRSLPISEPFQQTVDSEEYPDYYLTIPYPVDLGTIRLRLSNGYYRRLNSFLWDVKTIYRNAVTYNEEDSQIVESAEMLTELVCKFASDRNCLDPSVFYNHSDVQGVLDEGEEYKAETAESSDSATEIEDEAATNHNENAAREDSNEPPVVSSESRSKSNRKRILSEVSSDGCSTQSKRSKTVDDQAWVPLGVELVDEMISLPFSLPFRSPVDLDLYPDYTTYINHPMDFESVKRKLEAGTVPKSQIVHWTNKLSMHFENRVIGFLSNCGVDHTELSHLQPSRTTVTKASHTPSYDYDGAGESSTSNLDTNESSSSSVETEEDEERLPAHNQTHQQQTVNERKTSKRLKKNASVSEEESDYGAAGEYTDSDDDLPKRPQRKSNRASQRNRQQSRSWRKDSSEDRLPVTRPRRQTAGRRLSVSNEWDTYSSSSRPQRQAAVRARENVALLDLMEDVWDESSLRHNHSRGSHTRSRRFVSWDANDHTHGVDDQQISACMTRHGRIVRPSTRTRMYDGD
ncbi:bromodomain and WD repeat-containing protein 3-like isoform X2 [Corticium candelabrum]|uniref:bromodomain and WD repeat-containing protein 3-like isoform X2 n=1 Tax=Corticium candelabrum TaxID=121492 RepID=UPI002E263348|nr:bromodomain and WD repeat-containing protein 3-like isoform X2 [Corticium candelabrum]